MDKKKGLPTNDPPRDIFQTSSPGTQGQFRHAAITLRHLVTRAGGIPI